MHRWLKVCAVVLTSLSCRAASSSSRAASPGDASAPVALAPPASASAPASSLAPEVDAAASEASAPATMAQRELIRRCLVAAAIARHGIDVVSWIDRARLDEVFFAMSTERAVTGEGPPVVLGKERLLLVSNFPHSRESPDQDHFHVVVRLHANGDVDSTGIKSSKWGGPPESQTVADVRRLLGTLDPHP